LLARAWGNVPVGGRDTRAPSARAMRWPAATPHVCLRLMTSSADLFGPEPAGACDTYKKLRRPREFPRGVIVREHCERLWRAYQPYADPQFLAEFPIRFHQRWFEMYLTVSLLELGANVQRNSPPGPDVLVIQHGHRIWIEAVCGTGGRPGLPDSVVAPPPPEPGRLGNADSVPWDRIALRIRSSVEEKKSKFDGYLRDGHVSADDSLLIALNTYEIPHASLDSPRYVPRALYGIGNQVLHIALTDHPTVVASTYEELPFIPKLSTGAPVGTQPFKDGSMKCIAAVIASDHCAVSAAHKPVDFTLYPKSRRRHRGSRPHCPFRTSGRPSRAATGGL
jgi:hypothetical protein